MNQLAPIKDKWHELGLCLEVPTSDLNGLRKSAETDINKLSGVLNIWKDQVSLPYTWGTILDAVSGPIFGNTDLCRKIEQYLQAKKGEIKYL